MPAVAPPTAAAAAQVALIAGFPHGLAAEHRRASAINAAAGGFHDIAATAIGQGWSVEKTELEALLQWSRPQLRTETMPIVTQALQCLFQLQWSRPQLRTETGCTSPGRCWRHGFNGAVLS